MRYLIPFLLGLALLTLWEIWSALLMSRVYLARTLAHSGRFG